MARPKGSHDVAPMIRGAFKRAAKMLEQEGKPLSVLIKKHLEDDTLSTLKAMASYIPKEHNVTQRTVGSVSDLTDAELDQLKSLAITLLGGSGDGEETDSEGDASSVH